MQTRIDTKMLQFVTVRYSSLQLSKTRINTKMLQFIHFFSYKLLYKKIKIKINKRINA